MSGNRRNIFLLTIGIILFGISAKKQDEGTEATPTTRLQEDFEQNRKFLTSLPTAYEIVYPVQLRKNEEQGLSTRDFQGRHKHLHYHHTTIQFTAFGKRLKIRLDLNRELLSKGIKQKRHVDETTQMISENPIEHCYYKGRVRKMEGESLVAISTCDGIRGIIQVKNESYVIQPLTMIHDGNYTRHPHVIYRAVPVERRECANGRGTWRPYEELHKAEFLRKLKITRVRQSDRNVVEETKYLETALVMDYSIYKRMNYSYSATLQYALQLGNMIDAYLQDLNIQVHLVLVDIWNMKEEFEVHSDARWTLHNFFRYRHKTLRAVPYHIAQFITSKRFDNGESGMSVPDSVCSTRAVGVSMDPEPLDPQPTVSNAIHMIGHMLGMSHDEHDKCECSDVQGCLMEKARGGRREHTWTFSYCSQQDFNKTLLSGLGACLFEDPFEPSYEGICGDKKLDRGEECDCGSPEECEIWEPCCDPGTCLLRPWATCTGGPCCYNCTVLPETHQCRSAHGECDIPEFCDGQTGQCPVDDIVADGEQCNEGEHFCHSGLCHSYEDQCTILWGQGATQADDKCYEKFNSAGNFNGHCGQLSEDNYRKCEMENSKCGLLHCEGGEDQPIGDVKTNAVSSSVVYDGHSFQCKIVNGAAGSILTLGMVEDGTKCGDGRMCLNHTCITIADYFSIVCPTGTNNLTCSGQGKCTSTGSCFCHRGYAGTDCSIVMIPKTTTVLPTTVEEGENNDTVIDFAIYGLEEKNINAPAATTTEDIPVIIASEGNKTTQWLMIVLASVAGGALLLFCLSMLCYRRRSPMRLQKMNKRKMWLSKVMGSSRHSHKSDSSNGDDIPRLISFGNMPSYRADKRKKQMRRSGAASETGSEHSQNSARQSTEIRVPSTLTLAAPPEKGILKKQGARSTETLPLKAISLGGGEPSYRALASDSPYVASLESEYMAIGDPPYRQQEAAYRDRPMEVDDATQTSPMTPTDNGDDTESSYSDEAKEVLSPSDYDDLDDEEKDPDDFRRLWEGEDGRPQSGSGSGSDGHKSESPPPYSNKPPSRASSNGSQSSGGSGGSASGSGSSSGAESSRAKRLKDLDEIMRQIDEQAKRLVEARERESSSQLSPPRASVSPRPGNSAVQDRPRRSPPHVAAGGRDRSSDTEADRLLPRDGFYKQTDAETGQVEEVPVTSPQAEVMYLPNVKPSKHKSYSPLQIQIPNRPQSGKAASPPRSLSPRGGSSSQPAPPSKRELYSPRNGTKSKSPRTPSLCHQVESPTSPLSPMSDSKCIPEMPQITPRRVGQNPAFTKGNYGLYQNLPPPVSPRKTLLGHNGKREKSPLSRIDHEKLLARSSPLSSTSSSDNSEIYAGYASAVSPPRKNTQQHSPPINSADTLTAIPYRGVKTGDTSLPCSPPTTPRKQKRLDQSANSSVSSVGHSLAQRRPNKNTPEPPPRNLAISGNKLTHPLLDGYPFRRNSLTTDGAHSTSEGYHSDRADTDLDAVVIREIPIKNPKKNSPEPPLSPNHRQSYHEATSPDYVEM